MTSQSVDLEVDVAIIGAGTAGMVAFGQARKHTDRVVLIEGGAYGTTCARVGCMPSKLLIAAADAAHAVQEADQFGIRVGSSRIDGRAVLERVRRERDRFVGSVIDSIESIPETQRIRGVVRFEDRHTLVIDEARRVRASRVVIATGSRSHVVSMLEAAGERLATSDDVFEWDDLPGSVAVFGPGVIGLELGQALARLGVRVRMFGVGGALGPIRDSKIRALALETFNREFPLDPDAQTESIQRTGDGVEIAFRDADGGLQTETFDVLLAATGRRPNVDDLGLEHTGLALDDHGVPEFDRFTMRCGDSSIFIAGDVNAELPLLHESADEGRIAGANAGRYPDVRVGLRRAALSIVFTDPQFAAVGMSLEQARAHCDGKHAVGQVDFANQGRSRVMAVNRGLLRVYGQHGTGRFLGAEMFGPAAEHIAHLLAWSLEQHLSVEQMLAMPFYHPVIEEGLRSALRDLHDQLRLGPGAQDDCMEGGPGG